MQPRDVAHLTTLGTPTTAPDGTAAVVAVTRPDLEADEYRSRLWRFALDSDAPPLALTRGDQDTEPAYSPDGRQLAFLRREPEGRPQVWVLPTDGGEARRLTDLPGGAGTPRWSPDSTTIAFSARVPEEGRYGQDDDVTPDKERPRRITGLQYRLDGVGFRLDQRAHLFTVAASGEEQPHQLTDGDQDDVDVSWSPDGAWLVFASRRHEAREEDLYGDVFAVRRDGSDLRQLTGTTLGVGSPVVTPSGDTVVFTGLDPEPGGHWVAHQEGLWSVPFEGGTPTRLTDAERWQLSGGRPVVDDERALVLAEDRGAVQLLRVPLDGSGATPVTSGRHELLGLDAAAGKVVVTWADPETTGELGLVVDDELRPVTAYAKELREHLTPLPMDELVATAADGQELHGFVVVPDGEGPHPVLLMIHGGPFTQYPWSFFDEAQTWAGAGYAVVYTNPRGSSGYGAAYGEHIRGDVGARSAADLLTLLDAALERPDLDASWVGVLGGSHGGFMTSWLVGHHSDRFRAAVSERAVNAIDSFTGASDIGWMFADDLYGPDLEGQRRQSPLTWADQIDTPLLIIHSEHDWRCPVEQGQRLYVALRRRRAEVELLLFPGEGHELSRSGRPRHRVQRFEAIVDWFDRHR